ncbi:tyrosine-type recombinase/integrase [beta proteobacterium MWH-UniP1]
MLTETLLRQIKPGPTPKKLFDGNGTGLHVILHPSGRKTFALKYYHPITKKELTYTIGSFPLVSLREARNRVHELRKQIATGLDPREQGQKRKNQASFDGDTFRLVATDWMNVRGARWSVGYRHKVESMLGKHLYPRIGDAQISAITAKELLGLLRAIETNQRGCIAHTLLQHCSAVFRYAIATERGTNDPAAALRGALTPHKTKNHAAITDPSGFGELLWMIDSYQGDFVTRMGLRFTALTFQRSRNVRFARWAHIDWASKLWRIPAEEMKMREAHLVPLSAQSLEILRELLPLTGHSEFIFPSGISSRKPLSENTMLYALKRLGYVGRMTVHGFRTSASTLLNENGRHPDVIEAALAHTNGDVRAVYNKAKYLSERIEMCQWWADYCDSLRARAERSRNALDQFTGNQYQESDQALAQHSLSQAYAPPQELFLQEYQVGRQNEERSVEGFANHRFLHEQSTV